MDLNESKMLEKILDAQDDCIKKKPGECPQPEGMFPKQTPLAMAYVPFQSWEKPYDSQTALSRGTIFPSLDKPFIGKGAICDGDD